MKEKVIVCVVGSPYYTDWSTLFVFLDKMHCVDSPVEVVELLQGGKERGVDRLSGDWAKHRCVKIKTFTAKKKMLKISAEKEKNKRMLEYMLASDFRPIILACQGGPDIKGAAGMVKVALDAGIDVIPMHTNKPRRSAFLNADEMERIALAKEGDRS